MADESHATLKSLNCFTDLFQGSNLPWTYVHYIWCDSDITFSRGLHTKNCDSTVFLYNVCILVAKSMWGGWIRKLCPSGKSSLNHCCDHALAATCHDANVHIPRAMARAVNAQSCLNSCTCIVYFRIRI